ncbi:MAG: glycosyltransferase [Anaerolineales bacterium]|nr:glycosyltransferase [Anaerolineales bacterium]
MHIALLSEKFPPDPGGLGLSVQRLAHSLAGAGHSVHVLAPSRAVGPGQSQLAETPSCRNVRVQRLGQYPRADDTLSDWFAALVAAHRARPFDLTHGFFVHQAGFVAVYAGRYLGLPAVVSVRGNDLDKAVFEPGKAAHARYALEHAHAVTANSRDLQRKAQALAPGRPVTLVANGVDASVFTPGPRNADLARSLGLDERPVVGFVGEARAKKGLAPLLLAFRALAERRSAQLLLVGGVRLDDKDMLRVFRKQNPGLSIGVVEYVAPAKLPAYYNLLDILTLPSLRDGLPNALLEGMACARAVVATAAGGIPDALRDDENGRLVPINDAPALAAALAELVDDPGQRTRLGAQARATVQRDFTPEQELARNLKIYAQLVATT